MCVDNVSLLKILELASSMFLLLTIMSNVSPMSVDFPELRQDQSFLVTGVLLPSDSQEIVTTGTRQVAFIESEYGSNIQVHQCIIIGYWVNSKQRSPH